MFPARVNEDAKVQFSVTFSQSVAIGETLKIECEASDPFTLKKEPFSITEFPLSVTPCLC